MSVAEARAGTVQLGAFAIFGREVDSFEVAGIGQGAGVVGRLFGHLRDGNHGQLRAHQAPLGRVIVDKDKRIQADAKLFGNGAKIGGLVGPVRHIAGDVLPAQDHLGMPFEGFKRIGFVVFGADSQDYAPLGELFGIVLKPGKGLAGRAALPQHNALKAVIADDAAP